MPQLKFLLDENVDFPVAVFLRNLGFNVKTIAETERLQVIIDQYQNRLANNFLVVTEIKIRINEF